MGLPEASPALREAERYLDSLEMFGMRFGLERMRRLMTALGSPQERFATIHVVGSNGKSSTARMIAALLEQTGARTGAYLSPHLVSWAERVEVGGRPVPDERFAEAIARAAEAAAKVDRTLEPGDRVTQFEALTAAAYWELARAGVEVAVVEAGLGGRYDATSVIRSDVQVLTNVSLEHTRWLGPTERHIAEEKLAVVPAGGTLVTGPLGPEARDVAERVTAERGARLLMLGRDFRPRATTCGCARAGRSSARTSRSRWLRRRPTPAASTPPPCARRRSPVRRRAGWRWWPTAPLTILDGAHNPAGFAAVLRGARLRSSGSARWWPCCRCSTTRTRPACSPRWRRTARGRSSRARRTAARCRPRCSRACGGRSAAGAAEIVADPVAALERARRAAGADGAVLVTGSIYLLSDLARAGATGETAR